MINVCNITKYYGADLIMQDVSFAINQGEKIALVGVNGAGKSTLLKIIAGEELADAGQITQAKGMRIAYLPQDSAFTTDRSLWQEMESSLAHIVQWQKEIDQLAANLSHTDDPQWEEWMQQYGDLSARFEHAGGYEFERRIDYTLSHLGFSPEQYQAPVRHLSGGQKTRAALAAVLLADPDLLLLDEPTNHLDLQALEWLDSFLSSWRGTLLVISHDRYFLDHVTSRTLDLRHGRLSDYPANYSGYVVLRAEQQERLRKEYEAQQEHIAKTEEFIRRYKAGQRSKEASGREKRLNRLKEQQLIDRPLEQQHLRLSLQTQTRSGDRVLSLRNLVVGYRQTGFPPTPLVRIEKLELQRGERVALLGPNGSGKTTLLQTLLGHIPPIQGVAQFGHQVMVGYYAQGFDTLNQQATALAEILRVSPQLGEERARTLLGRFLFSGDDVFKQVSDLSGGERNRLALAQLTLHSGNLLILDEPTNHLDMNTREVLEAVLSSYTGSILFVSHDRSFIDALADKLWIIESGHLIEYDGPYQKYGEERQAMQEGKSGGGKAEERQQKKANRLAAQEERQRKKQLAQLEATIAQLEADIAAVAVALEEASSIQDVARITELGKRYTELEQQRDQRYHDWAELIEQVELSLP